MEEVEGKRRMMNHKTKESIGSVWFSCVDLMFFLVRPQNRYMLVNLYLVAL